MNKFGSMSMLIDETQINKTFIKEKRNTCWLSDNNVNTCYNCQTTFGYFVRKHHCRSCGRIFCHKCSNNYVKLLTNLETYPIKPKYISHKLMEYVNKDLERVCESCYKYINDAKHIEDNIILICLLKLNILEIKKLLYVNKNWFRSVSFYVSHFRELQYKLTWQCLTEFDKQILEINKTLIGGHNKLMFQYINAFNKSPDLISILKTKKTIPCLKLMCTRSCCSSFDHYDLILLLKYENNEIRKFLVKKLKQINVEKLICFVSLLVKYLLFDDKNNMLLLDFIIDKCIENPQFRNKVYFEINYNIAIKNNGEFYWQIKTLLQNKIESSMGKYIRDQLLLSESFIVDLIQVYNNNNKKTYLKSIASKYNNHLYFPLCDECFEEIDYANIKIFDSYTKPIKIPLINSDKEYNILLKSENVRKDGIICDIIKLAVEILKNNKERNIDLNLDLYNILPLNENYGFVEFKKNSTTLFDINESGKTLFNYIIEKNKNKNINEIRKTFINSLSLYCVITYLFGIGDRHLENIMINDDGSLFHIDYSYIFSDPKNIEIGMRITKDMVDVMGGVDSVEYKQFKEQTTYIYNHLRKYVNVFLEMIMLLENYLDRDFMLNEIIKRFEPNEKMCNAELHLVTNIDNSTNSYNHKMADWIHYLYKKTNSFL